MNRKRRKLEVTPEHARAASAEKGWLRAVLVLTEGRINGRWPYWLAVRANGTIGDPQEWPVPQVRFSSVYDGGTACDQSGRPAWVDPLPAEVVAGLGTRSEARAHLESAFRAAWYDGTSISDLVAWWLWAFGSASVDRCPDLSDRAVVAMFRDVELQRLIAHPADWAAYLMNEYLGKSKWRGAAWFPTPVQIATLMGEMVLGVDANREQAEGGPDPRTIKVHDPCVGTGALLLPASNYSLNLSGCDIDRTLCLLCEWQAWLYVPWLAMSGSDCVWELGAAEASKRRADVLLELMRGPTPAEAPADQSNDGPRIQLNLFGGDA